LETGKSKAPGTAAEILFFSSHGLKKKLESLLETGQRARVPKRTVFPNNTRISKYTSNL
jgi:hypothetical protein